MEIAKQAAAAASGAMMLLVARSRGSRRGAAAADADASAAAVITPRRTRLIRVPDLAAFRATLTDSIIGLSPDEVRDTLVLVPTRAAAEQLRRTVEDRALTGSGDAFVWPLAGTRDELYDELASRLASSPPRLSAFEREVILAGVGRDLDRGGPRGAVSAATGAGRRDSQPVRPHPAAGTQRGRLRAELPRGARTRAGHGSRRPAVAPADRVSRRRVSRIRGADGERWSRRRARAPRAPARHRSRSTAASSHRHRLRSHRRARRPVAGGFRPADAAAGTARSSTSSAARRRWRPGSWSGCTRRFQSSRRSARRTPHAGHHDSWRRRRRSAARTEPVCYTYRDREEELAAVARRVKADRQRRRRRRCTARRLSCSVRCRISISRATCSPITRLPSRRSTRCRWRPSRMPRRSISRSMP